MKEAKSKILYLKNLGFSERNKEMKITLGQNIKQVVLGKLEPNHAFCRSMTDDRRAWFIKLTPCFNLSQLAEGSVFALNCDGIIAMFVATACVYDLGPVKQLEFEFE